jgi:hypothetical protein
MDVSSHHTVPFLGFDGLKYEILQQKEDGPTGSPGSEGSQSSIKFTTDPDRLSGSTLATYNRLFGRNNEEIAAQIRSTFSSSSGTSTHSLQSTGKSSSPQEEEARLFYCIKEKNPFHITCHTNTNYELSGYGTEIRIRYKQDDLLLMGYSVAILDFIYRNKNNEKESSEKGDLPIVLRANTATSDNDFNKILQDRASLETMILWCKTRGDPGASYRFDRTSLPAIEKLFQAIGLTIDIAKENRGCFPCPGVKPEFEQILQDGQSRGELISRRENLVSYFSG